MSAETILFILRLAIAVALYGFLGAVLLITLQEIRLATLRLEETRQAAARLVIVERHDDVPVEIGHGYRLQPLTTIGRGLTNTIVLADSFASAEHAQVIFRGNQWQIEDLDSRNGTMVNDIPIEGTVVLATGDQIGIGRVTLRFEG